MIGLLFALSPLMGVQDSGQNPGFRKRGIVTYIAWRCSMHVALALVPVPGVFSDVWCWRFLY